MSEEVTLEDQIEEIAERVDDIEEERRINGIVIVVLCVSFVMFAFGLVVGHSIWG